MMMTYHGKFKPKNITKYVGNSKNIIYRSSWECKFMNWLDKTDSVKFWASEEIFIQYFDPVAKKTRRYFPDFVAQMETKSGNQIFLIEIKPEKQTKPPKITTSKKKSKKFLFENMTWLVNSAKWDAANNFCVEKGWVFKIVTEHYIDTL